MSEAIPMLLAALLLILGLVGILPLVVALPLSGGTLLFGGVSMGLLQRRMAGLPPRNGPEAMVGATAPALTNIERDGQIRYGNEIWNAKTLMGRIDRGQVVRILRFEGLRAVVVVESDTGG